MAPCSTSGAREHDARDDSNRKRARALSERRHLPSRLNTSSLLRGCVTDQGVQHGDRPDLSRLRRLFRSRIARHTYFAESRSTTAAAAAWRDSSSAKASRSFWTTSAGAADEARVGELLRFAAMKPSSFSTPCFLAISARRRSARPDRRRPPCPSSVTLALSGGAVTSGPQAVARALAIDAKYGSIGRSSSAVAASQRTEKSSRRLRRHVLPAADVAHRAQHLLEPGEVGLDLRVLPRRIALGPGGDHDALGRRLAARRCPRSRRDLAQQLPDVLGQERDHRVQQPQQRVERVGQHPLGDRARAPRPAAGP